MESYHEMFMMLKTTKGEPTPTLTLKEKLSFATCLMQLKNVTCNYFGVACDMCSCKIVACDIF